MVGGMAVKKKSMPPAVLAHVARRFALLGDPTRLEILQSLMAGERPVNDIVAVTGATQANVSRHLKILHDAALVSRRRQGIQVFYGIADPSLFQLCEIVCSSLAGKAAAEAHSLRAHA
jgi:DNA-binding transcriptional ArsR family regulator